MCFGVCGVCVLGGLPLIPARGHPTVGARPTIHLLDGGGDH